MSSFTFPLQQQKRHGSGPAPAPAWTHLLTLYEASASRSNNNSNSNNTSPDAAFTDAVVSWWRAHHRGTAFAEPHVSSSAANADQVLSTPLPHESAEVAVLTRAIAMFIQWLQAAAAAAVESPPFVDSGGEPNSNRNNSSGRKASVEVTETLLEMEAVMVFLVRDRLRYFTIPTEPAAQAAAAEVSTAATATATATASAVVPPVTSKQVVAVDTAAKEAESSLFLQRGRRERVKDMVPVYSQVQLLQLTVLIETVQAVLVAGEEAAAPANFTNNHINDSKNGNSSCGYSTDTVLSHDTRSALYSLAVTALGAAEQLPGHSLAALATCLARGAESYAITLLIQSHRRHGATDNTAGGDDNDDGDMRSRKRQCDGGVGGNLESRDGMPTLTPAFFLRRSSAGDDVGGGLGSGAPTSNTIDIKLSLVSPELRLSKQRESRLLGGDNVNTTVRPTEVLGHLTILCAAVKLRLEAALRAEELGTTIILTSATATTNGVRASTGAAVVSVPPFASLWKECVRASSHGGFSGGDDGDDSASSGASTLAVAARHSDESTRREQSTAKAQLGLRSLADRKAAETAGTGNNGGGQQRRRRQTVGSIAATGASSTACPTNTNTGQPTAAVTPGMSTADVAEVCTAVAALRFYPFAPPPPPPPHNAKKGQQQLPPPPQSDRFWAAVVRHTCRSAHRFSTEWGTQRDTASDGNQHQQQQRGGHSQEASPDGCDGHVDDDDDKEEEERATRVASSRQFLRDMRDVAFALDFLDRRGEYDALMHALVRLGFLEAYLPPPSSSAYTAATSMKEMKDAKRR